MDFRIARDDYGVPHVRGETAEAAWFGMGYACAQDRMFQMDYDRRRACGRWAEIAGPSAVGADLLARRLRLAAAARGDIAAMSPPLRAAFGAYAAGVNRALADGALPLPGRYPVEPWEPWHSVAAFKVRHVLMGQWQHKLAQAVLLARVGPEAFGRLETRPPAGSPLAVPPGARLSRLVDNALADVTAHLGFLAEAEPGSNAWAVSGRRTVHGGAVLCNDSHRALDTPNVYWQCRVSCPEFDVTGATFPGLPGFPHFGWNGRVAWAITHAEADNQDLYLERFEGPRYLTPEGWAEAEARAEEIAVRGGGTVAATVWSTRHGPVVHGDPRSGMALALKYTATYRPDRGFECMLPMLVARDVRELADAQDGWVDPVNNLVCADVAGRIAYQCRGELPVRAGTGHRRLPVPGWDGSCEWTGTVPFSALPRVIDPPAGFVMTANNAIVDGDEPYISCTFAQPFRAERLRSLLAGSAALSVSELAGMQADTVSWAARSWSRVLGELEPLPDGPAEAARALLAGWDGDLAAGSGAALLYACFQRALAEALYRPVLGPDTWEWVASGALAPTVGMVRRWLASDTWELLGGPVPPAWAPDGERAKRVLAAVPGALAGAWAAAVEHAGPDPRQWRWGDLHQAVRVHPLEAAGLAAGPFPPVPMGGDADTIQAAGYGWRQRSPFTVLSLSVYRQVVDLADPGSASYAIPGGSSGDPASPHFDDQLAEWAAHRRIPMGGRASGAPRGGRPGMALRPGYGITAWRFRRALPEPGGSENHDLGADRKVGVVVTGVRDGQVDAAVRRGGEAAAVEGDPARREEDRPWHRLAGAGVDVVRACLPGHAEQAARGDVRRSRGPGRHPDRAEGDRAGRLQPGEARGQVYAGHRLRRAQDAVARGQRRRWPRDGVGRSRRQAAPPGRAPACGRRRRRPCPGGPRGPGDRGPRAGRLRRRAGRLRRRASGLRRRAGGLRRRDGRAGHHDGRRRQQGRRHQQAQCRQQAGRRQQGRHRQHGTAHARRLPRPVVSITGSAPGPRVHAITPIRMRPERIYRATNSYHVATVFRSETHTAGLAESPPFVRDSRKNADRGPARRAQRLACPVCRCWRCCRNSGTG